MSEKPHTVALGAFVVGAILIAITIVIFALGSGFGRDRSKAIMVFDGSIKGLTVGAPLALRGVQIGQVTDIELMLDTDAIELIMVVEVEINRDKIIRLGHSQGDLTDELIARGMRAQLDTQSLLTGLLYIQLDFDPDQPPVLADIKSPYIQIPTIPTDLQQLARKVEEMDLAKLAGNIQTTIEGLNTFVTGESFQSLPVSLHNTLASVTALSDQLREQLETTVPKLDNMLDGASDTLAGASAELPKLSAMAQQNLALLEDAIAAFEQTMTDVNGLVAPDSGTTYRLNQALRELAAAGRALKLLAESIDEKPESLIRGRSGN